MNPLYIYAPYFSARLVYTIEFIFTNYVKAEYKLIDDVEEINKHRYPFVLNYSFETLPVHDFWIKPHDLLNETEIRAEIDLQTGYRGSIPYFFTNKNDDLGFDVFSSVFYLISRYEEYQAGARFDQYGRYKPACSILYQLEVLQKPLVDYWMRWLFKAIQDKYPTLELHKPNYTFRSTIDIDNAFAFKHKGLIRQGGGLARDFLGGRFGNASQRVQTWFNAQQDPYDTYSYIFEQHQQYKIKPLFFFLLGDRNGVDTALDHQNEAFRALIATCDEHGDVELHNSYASTKRAKKLKEEKARLETILNKEVSGVRQHYLAVRLPKTYRTYQAAGLKADYSMGYASINGFRAGTSFPFFFYDLPREEKLDVKVYASPIMEVTLQQYLKLSPEEAVKAYEVIINEVKKSDGVLISLWHNESLSEQGAWKGWRMVFERMLEMMG